MSTDQERPEGPAGEVEQAGSSGLWWKALLGLGALVALYLVGRYLGGYLEQFSRWVDGLGVWGPIVFIAGYAIATVLLAPGSILTLAAGAIFGLLEGVLYVFVGSTLGACGAFLVARYVARRAVERRLDENERFERIDDAVGRQGLKIVTLMRLSPVFPFNLLNYGLGLTKVRFWHYAVACIGMLPGTLLYVYYGKVAGDIATAASGAVEKDWRYWTFLGVGLAATVIVTVIVARIAQRALAERVEGEGGRDDE